MARVSGELPPVIAGQARNPVTGGMLLRIIVTDFSSAWCNFPGILHALWCISRSYDWREGIRPQEARDYRWPTIQKSIHGDKSIIFRWFDGVQVEIGPGESIRREAPDRPGQR